MEQQKPFSASGSTATPHVETPAISQQPLNQLPPVLPSPPPAQPPSTPAPTPPNPSKSGNPWPWIVGGCLGVVVIICATVFILGWWGIREAKKEINNRIDKYEPTVDKMKENVDRLNKEGEEWEKESEKLRDIPDQEESQN